MTITDMIGITRYLGGFLLCVGFALPLFAAAVPPSPILGRPPSAGRQQTERELIWESVKALALGALLFGLSLAGEYWL